MSASYRIFETTVFQQDMENLLHRVRSKIGYKMGSYVYPQLREEPHFGPNIKKLRNWEPETWRYRIGPWRFFYEIGEKERIVFMTAINHRKDAYR